MTRQSEEVAQKIEALFRQREKLLRWFTVPVVSGQQQSDVVESNDTSNKAESNKQDENTLNNPNTFELPIRSVSKTDVKTNNTFELPIHQTKDN